MSQIEHRRLKFQWWSLETTYHRFFAKDLKFTNLTHPTSQNLKQYTTHIHIWIHKYSLYKLSLLRIKCLNFIFNFINCMFINIYETFRTSAEIINITSVNVKPKCMNVKIMMLQPLFKKSIGSYILQLLKRIYLRKFILY